jgi:hypothetical protein
LMDSLLESFSGGALDTEAAHASLVLKLTKADTAR